MKTIPTASAETSALIRLLAAAEVGQVVTYEAMSEAIGCDVRTRRGPLGTARKRVLDDDGIHTAAVRGVGVKRLSHAEAASTTLRSRLDRARRQARLGRKTAARLVIGEIPQEERGPTLARASMLELIEYGASAKAHTKVTAAIASSDEEALLPLRKAFAALKD